MIEGLLGKLTETIKGQALAWTLVVAILIALIQIIPSVYKDYSLKNSSMISLDDTYSDVLKTLYYHNKPILNSFREELRQARDHPRGVSRMNSITKGILARGFITATEELNRFPHCMKRVGNWISDNLDNSSLESEIVEVLINDGETMEAKIKLIELTLTSYEHELASNIKQHMRGIKRCGLF